MVYNRSGGYYNFMQKSSFNQVKGLVNCQNSRDKGPPEGNSACG